MHFVANEGSVEESDDKVVEHTIEVVIHISSERAEHFA